MKRFHRFDFRNVIVIVGAALFFPLLVGTPLLPAWLRPYAHASTYIVGIGMFGAIAIYNKWSTGLALPGGGKDKAKIDISRIGWKIVLIMLGGFAFSFLFHLNKGLTTAMAAR